MDDAASTWSDAGGASVVITGPEKKGWKKIRQYMMGEVLGEGAQGKVREALDSETLRRVAIKRINLRHLRKIRNADANLQRELVIHRKLKHKHVIELIENFMIEEKQKVYCVYEHVSGGSLQDLSDSLTDNVVPADMLRRFTWQLFGGLAYCHTCGVIHRDIKPSNLLVSTAGVLKLADFGVAEELGRYEADDACSKSRGSPAFQPPEVAAGHESFSGFKVDVWAAGVSLYLLSSGQVPFEGSSLMHLFERIEAGEYAIPERIASDEPLVGLIRGLLTVEQAERLSVPAALVHPWLEGAEDQRWSDKERELVSSVVRGAAKPHAVMRSVARMYGEEWHEDDDQDDDPAVVAASSFDFESPPLELPPPSTASSGGAGGSAGAGDHAAGGAGGGSGSSSSIVSSEARRGGAEGGRPLACFAMRRVLTDDGVLDSETKHFVSRSAPSLRGSAKGGVRHSR